ncbi:MAG: hypothetical protein A4E35_02115 [Methanoregula sp. PtaU1.Bin051]|nr:MAG: hypothetical protein A4E35_02115 [Methanoregula sp. PtaU1.Bin051]
MLKIREILTNGRCRIFILLLLIFVFLIIALNMFNISGMKEKEVSKNMTKESLNNENLSEGNGNMTQKIPLRLNQQQVLDYWKKVLPDDVNKEMYRIRFTSSQNFSISLWEIDPNNEQVTFYICRVRNQDEIHNIQGKKIDNWTIRIIHDTEFEKEIDSIYIELNKLKMKPELQILSFYAQKDPWVVPPKKEIILWVKNQTPENQQLDKTDMRGWKISVYIDSGIDLNKHF